MPRIQFKLLSASEFARKDGSGTFGSLYVGVGDETASISVPVEIVKQLEPFCQKGRPKPLMEINGVMKQVSNEDGSPMVHGSGPDMGKLVHNIDLDIEPDLAFVGYAAVTAVRGLPTTPPAFTVSAPATAPKT